MINLIYYTDGSWSNKTKNGGWAWALISENNSSVLQHETGMEPYSTNNRMELKALSQALKNLAAQQSILSDVKAIFYIDSALICNCLNEKWYSTWMSNNWKTADRQDVKNKELWSEILVNYIKLKKVCDIKIVKVSSHTNNRWNDFVDKLAVDARKQLDWLDGVK